jgi:hypothetical protein
VIHVSEPKTVLKKEHIAGCMVKENKLRIMVHHMVSDTLAVHYQRNLHLGIHAAHITCIWGNTGDALTIMHVRFWLPEKWRRINLFF